jgi:3-methyladenine DNA glycosylase AlkC
MKKKTKIKVKKQIDNPNAFKNFINSGTVDRYVENLELVLKNPISPKIIKQLKEDLVTLELKQRVQLIREALKKVLDPDYEKAINQLLKIADKQAIKGFELWPMTEFIQTYGLKHHELSLKALYKLTPMFTAEFAIRPFLNSQALKTYTDLKKWAHDPNPHIRRWLSEGTRPRLPWGEKLKFAIHDPTEGLKILEHLKFDSELYVRKSVSNHLNDIAKDHPQITIETIQRWQKLVPYNYKKEFEFIKKQSLRTLIKAGHPQALKLMGVNINKTDFSLKFFQLNSKKINLNESLEFEFEIKNKTSKPQKYILDYKIYHRKANSDLSPKVFKLKTGSVDSGESLKVRKKHSFKLITTRKYYSGEHRVELVINGNPLKTLSFELKV